MGCHLQRRWCHHPTGHGVMAGGAPCSPGISAFPQTPGSTQQVPRLGPQHHTAAVLAPDLRAALGTLPVCAPHSAGNLKVCGALSTSVSVSLPPIPASLSPALSLFFFSHLCQCFQISLVLCLPTSVSLLQTPCLSPFCGLGLVPRHLPLSQPSDHEVQVTQGQSSLRTLGLPV